MDNPINLAQTLAWKEARRALRPESAAELAMLHDLQGNILKGHGRPYTSNLFLSFHPQRRHEASGFVAGVGARLTTALEQLIQAEDFRSSGRSGGDFMAFMLTAAGYRALGQAGKSPGGEAFEAGMKARPSLGDPASAEWEPHFQGEIHAMLLIGADNRALRDTARDRMVARIHASGGAVRLLNPHRGEDGQALFNDDGRGIEHFGYVDGRSQPLALQEDVDEEHKNGGIDAWSPAIPLGQLLLRCPGGALDVSHGSYFVFRKLDQNVRAFKRRERDLAAELEARHGRPPGDIGERQGASVVGRFENGMPVTAQCQAQRPPPPPGSAAVPNNFNYTDDEDGLKCPFAGHIRKTNPRSDVNGSKDRLMARRGIPYGSRNDAVNGPGIDDKPEGGVGLLFMAYRSNLERQFEFTQAAWANNVSFPRPLARPGPATGVDPAIGQPGGPSGQQWPVEYGKSLSDGRDEDDFSGFVRMRGGEYFFAPSISFLTRIQQRP